LSLRNLLAVSLIGFACAAARALDSSEVLVVGNAKVPESAELASYYGKMRGIPADNILLVETTDQYLITREHYEAQIRQPLRQYLTERGMAGQIKCICLIWGMPVRVAAGRPAGDICELMSAYRAVATKAEYRLASDVKLLATVARKFPQPRTEGLAPVGMLFDTAPTMPSGKMPTPGQLLEQFNKLFELKDKEVRALHDPRKRRIAARQLMALQLDVNGLKGLIRYLGKPAPIKDAPDLQDLRRRLNEAKAELDKLDVLTSKDGIEAAADRIELIAGVYELSKFARGKLNLLRQSDASLDSELALLWWPKYRLLGPLLNPLFWRVSEQAKLQNVPPLLMTARIDGPSAAVARRIIDDSVAAQREGLEGTFYIDAGGKHPPYDAHLRKLKQLVQEHTKLKLIYDDKNATFPPGSCPDAALYVGWYSLRKYVQAFKWNRGAVGWHIASFEAMHLRDPDSQEWCVKMLQNGVAGTLGAVDEPYLTTFPAPEEFFALLLTGKYTLAECYWRTVPVVSWRMTLIGDPLYTPFARNPQLSLEALPKGLAPPARQARSDSP